MILREQNVCLNTGEEAIDFSLPDQDGNYVNLSDYYDDCNVVVTLNPGKLNDSCKDYLLFYKEHLVEFSALDTQVLGINMGSVLTNKEWNDSIEGLGFPLLSDQSPIGGVSLKYDCFVPGEGYGKRAVFVIDKKGIIRHIEVLSGDHGACPDLNRLLEVLRSLT
ncbi:MAG: redoxin domain-containing protein [Candidatus Thorarchaeota archaeon]|jgi:peroxiredoxin (alkyl hydroperoxide reductase subunit C)